PGARGPLSKKPRGGSKRLAQGRAGGWRQGTLYRRGDSALQKIAGLRLQTRVRRWIGYDRRRHPRRPAGLRRQLSALVSRKLTVRSRPSAGSTGHAGNRRTFVRKGWRDLVQVQQPRR